MPVQRVLVWQIAVCKWDCCEPPIERLEDRAGGGVQAQPRGNLDSEILAKRERSTIKRDMMHPAEADPIAHVVWSTGFNPPNVGSLEAEVAIVNLGCYGTDGTAMAVRSEHLPRKHGSSARSFRDHSFTLRDGKLKLGAQRGFSHVVGSTEADRLEQFALN